MYYGQSKIIKGKRIFIGFHGAFTLINGKEVDKYTPWEPVCFESIIDPSKEIPSLLSLIASIEFNDLVSVISIIVVFSKSKFSAK